MGNCKICGEPSGYFPLCKKCNALKDSGKIVKCDDCGEWHYANTTCKCKKSTVEVKPQIVYAKHQTAQGSQGKSTCIVCGKDAPNGSLCRECYYEMRDFKDSFDKNSKVFDLKDYYFNLRSNIYRMKNFDFIQSNCNKLMALAVLTKELFGDESLTDRAVSDIEEIIEKKKPEEKQPSSEFSKTLDSRKEEFLRTADGHYVKSNPESVIDDILYDLRIVHCYEKNAPISSDEVTVKADWFIPVTDGRHGIYIEYWGMNTKEYLANKERKKAAYKEHDIPLIEIERDDYKDRHGLSDRLVAEINALAKKYFRILDFIR